MSEDSPSTLKMEVSEVDSDSSPAAQRVLHVGMAPHRRLKNRLLSLRSLLGLRRLVFIFHFDSFGVALDWTVHSQKDSDHEFALMTK